MTERLEVLVGRWRTEGSTREAEGAPAMVIDATDTYEWLPGGFALLHTVDAKVGEERVEGAEIIGWDSDRQAYRTLYFGSDGPNAYQAKLDEEEGGLVWRMWSEADRFTGTFSDDRSRLTGHWERLDESSGWQPWMDIKLTKQDA